MKTKTIKCTKVVLLFCVFMTVSAGAWEIDFSRRGKQRPPTQLPEKNVSEKIVNAEAPEAVQSQPPSLEKTVQPSNIVSSSEEAPMIGELPQPEVRRNPRLKNLISSRSSKEGDRQAFVILNTDKGFVPSNIRIYKGGRYRVHVVNINNQNKNLSFMLDYFNQNHATFFGSIKTFEIDPEKEGVYKFTCPETGADGKLLVFSHPNGPSPTQRSLSSEDP